MIIRSPYTPDSIYLRGTTPLHPEPQTLNFKGDYSSQGVAVEPCDSGPLLQKETMAGLVGFRLDACRRRARARESSNPRNLIRAPEYPIYPIPYIPYIPYTLYTFSTLYTLHTLYTPGTLKGVPQKGCANFASEGASPVASERTFNPAARAASTLNPKPLHP